MSNARRETRVQQHPDLSDLCLPVCALRPLTACHTARVAELGICGLVQATVAVGTVLIWDFCVAHTKGGGGTICLYVPGTLGAPLCAAVLRTPLSLSAHCLWCLESTPAKPPSAAVSRCIAPFQTPPLLSPRARPAAAVLRGIIVDVDRSES